MMRSLWAAATGMIGQQLNVDTIAHNLANVNTTGYKRQRVDFQDLMYQTLRRPGSPAAEGTELPTGIQVGLGTRAAATSKNFSQGTFENTGNTLDLAIEGNGFFQVTLPSGAMNLIRSIMAHRSAMVKLVAGPAAAVSAMSRLGFFKRYGFTGTGLAPPNMNLPPVKR